MTDLFDEKVNEKLTVYECLDKLCKYKENNIYIDCKYFKHLIKHKVSEDNITNRLEEIFSAVLNQYNRYTIHICLKGITITDCDKHKEYTKKLSYKLYYLSRDEPENTLQILYIYNPSSIFTVLHRLIEMMCCLDIKNRIKMIK